jgi:response regulator RpfG family c-di-GMP phosphodiesterase
MNGIELRDKIFKNNFLKFIPFVFLTTCSTQEIVNHAYSKPVQGYINKPESFEKLKASLLTSIEYWKIHLTPKTEYYSI